MSADDSIVIATQAHDHIRRETGHRPTAIIPVSIGGELHAGVHCQSFNIAIHEIDDEQHVVVAMSVAGQRSALYQQLDAEGAVEFAAALYRAARQLGAR
ncbi:MAG: hypothetical protein ACTHOJ_08450 [Sphingomonas oligoaromativorans]